MSHINIVPKSYKHYSNQIPPKAKSRNLIPRDHKHVLSVMLDNQDKFNLVMEKLIEALDRLDNHSPKPKKKQIIEVAAK